MSFAKPETDSAAQAESSVLSASMQFGRCNSIGDADGFSPIYSLFPDDRHLRAESLVSVAVDMLFAHFEASSALFKQRQLFLCDPDAEKTPFVVAVAGRAAAPFGPSFSAVLARDLKQRYPFVTLCALEARHFYCSDLATPNSSAEPASLNGDALLDVLSKVKGGLRDIRIAPEGRCLDDRAASYVVIQGRPDILFIEGPVLLSRDIRKDEYSFPLAFDFFDYSIFVDADGSQLLRPDGHFAVPDRADVSNSCTVDWRQAVLPKLDEHVSPTLARANLLVQLNSRWEIKDLLVRRI